MVVVCNKLQRRNCKINSDKCHWDDKRGYCFTKKFLENRREITNTQLVKQIVEKKLKPFTGKSNKLSGWPYNYCNKLQRRNCKINSDKCHWDDKRGLNCFTKKFLENRSPENSERIKRI